MDYTEFLKSKIVVADKFGKDLDQSELNQRLFPHQADIVQWSLSGGRRAIFGSFGLGKTFMQLELARLTMQITEKPFLICMPLAVVGEFKKDQKKLENPQTLKYITDTDEITEYDQNTIYLTNYERVRKGDIDASKFGGVSFDEASILRNLKTQTTNYVLQHFKKVPYRFVATATPTPNDYIEILNYADYLGVIDRGHALTRFFQRDSTKAGNLTLYPNKKKEFWQWVSTWAVFINDPSDLGYSSAGYDLPKLHIYEVEVQNISDEPIVNKHGELVLFKDASASLPEASREKTESIALRVNKAKEIYDEHKGRFVLWHHREAERQEINRVFKGCDMRSVYGSQHNDEKEKHLVDFGDGKYDILSTKPKIAGSGCNFQICNQAIFVGIDYKFNDFIQAIHRFYRFGQRNDVHIWIIHTQNEREILKSLKRKWKQHDELQKQMISLVREYGLNTDKIKSQMERQIFKNRREYKLQNATVINNDSVIEVGKMPDNSKEMILTSIPFGDHYEYSDNYNDMGHNHGNENFFKQMDYLTPELLRVLKPGRIAAIHVKDRIRYSYQNGAGFTTIDDFSGKTVAHFQKHGFWLTGKITITTDVVRENNQTYRLGWSEQCKDASKMGVGLPEYVLLFRKAPTDLSNGYADEPIKKTKEEYDRATWQLDAHAYWKTSGDRLLSSDDIGQKEVKFIRRWYEKHQKEQVYQYAQHLNLCKDLEDAEKLSALFMTLPPVTENPMVWTDINRMNTLNARQAGQKKEKHICPLQLDIIERLINRFTMKGETILDPFGGLFSTAYQAVKMGRKSVCVELNPAYYDDGLYYMKAQEYQMQVPTLFDLA